MSPYQPNSTFVLNQCDLIAVYAAVSSVEQNCRNIFLWYLKPHYFPPLKYMIPESALILSAVYKKSARLLVVHLKLLIQEDPACVALKLLNSYFIFSGEGRIRRQKHFVTEATTSASCCSNRQINQKLVPSCEADANTAREN